MTTPQRAIRQLVFLSRQHTKRQNSTQTQFTHNTGLWSAVVSPFILPTCQDDTQRWPIYLNHTSTKNTDEQWEQIKTISDISKREKHGETVSSPPKYQNDTTQLPQPENKTHTLLLLTSLTTGQKTLYIVYLSKMPYLSLTSLYT